MSIKNAPPKWIEIENAAKACGADQWAMRKWLTRCKIPADWQIKIVQQARGTLSFDDMVIVDRRGAEMQTEAAQ